MREELGIGEDMDVPEPDSEKEASKDYASDEEMHQMFKQYKQAPDENKDKKVEIMKNMDGFVHQAVQPYRNSGAPVGAMYQKAYEEVDRAIDQWDPNHESGAPLKSYVYKRLFPLGNPSMSVVNRVIPKYKDVKKMTQKNTRSVDEARRLQQEFKNERGRMPSNSEMADMMGMSEREVSKLMRSMSGTHYADNMIDEDQSLQDIASNEMDALRSVYYSTSGRTKRIIEMIMWPDLGGEKPETYDENQHNWPKQSAIADELGVHPSTVNREIKKIKKRVQEVL